MDDMMMVCQCLKIEIVEVSSCNICYQHFDKLPYGVTGRTARPYRTCSCFQNNGGMMSILPN